MYGPQILKQNEICALFRSHYLLARVAVLSFTTSTFTFFPSLTSWDNKCCLSCCASFTYHRRNANLFFFNIHLVEIPLFAGQTYSISLLPSCTFHTFWAFDMHPTTFVLLLVSSFAQTSFAVYQLAEDYSGDGFFRGFEFFTDADPTNGHVQFQSMTAANASGLAGFMNGGNATRAIYLGVDTTSQAPNGRGAVRVSSQKSFQHALVVADIVHMPQGCGTWPAFWMVGQNWPNDGKQY